MVITQADINNFEKLYRVNLINSLTGFKSASLIGTISKSGNTNLAIFNSVIHVGANPPLIGHLMRPVSAQRHTYNNIKEAGYYTINHIHKDIFKKAHQTSARYPEDISEFDKCDLSIETSTLHPAPYVMESNIKVGLKFVEESEIKSNGTIFMVGEIIEIILPNDILDDDGFVNIEQAGTVAISGLDSYHNTNQITRLSYAKPGIELREI